MFFLLSFVVNIYRLLFLLFFLFLNIILPFGETSFCTVLPSVALTLSCCNYINSIGLLLIYTKQLRSESYLF